jgi:AcrR family transcriptional regulator
MMARPAKGRGLEPAAVLDVAAEVLGARGYAGMTLDEVARRLGVTRQAILHHFATKQTLLKAVLERERAWAARMALAATGTDEDDSPIDGLARYLGLDADSRQRIRLQHVLQGEAIAGDPVAQDFIALRTRGIRDLVTARVQAVAASGRLAPGWSVDAAATALVALVNGLQALLLVDADTDAALAFDRFAKSLVTERNLR